MVAANFIAKKLSQLEHGYDEIILVFHRTLPTHTGTFTQIQGNVADPYFVQSLFESINKTSSIDVIDCIIDKRTVQTMKQSIQKSAQVLATIAQNDKRIRIISVSTTAILAPLPYRSGYANAKLQEFRTFQYLHSVSLLCPQIAQATSQKLAYSNHRKKLAIDLTTLADVLFYFCKTPKLTGVFSVDKSLLSTIPASGNHDASPLENLRTVLDAAKQWIFNPQTRQHSERVLTYTLLDLTPRSFEQKLDHHLIPPTLIRRFEKLFQCKITAIKGTML